MTEEEKKAGMERTEVLVEKIRELCKDNTKQEACIAALSFAATISTLCDHNTETFVNLALHAKLSVEQVRDEAIKETSNE